MSGLSARRPEYPSLGADGLRVVLAAIEEATRLPAKPSADDVLKTYSELFERTYGQLSVMVGAKGAQAIMQRAIKRASARFPALSAATVSEVKVAFEPVRADATTPDELRRAMEHLFLTQMDVLASLIGIDLLATLLERMTTSNSPDGGDR